MVFYFFRKTSHLLISLFAILLLTFLLMKSIPGDPFIDEKVIPEEILDQLYRYYGLDKPLHVQFFYYLKGLFSGTLGPSYIYQGRTVEQIIAKGFPISAALGAEALVIAIVVGLFLGSMAALFEGKWPDVFFAIFATLGISIPSFLIASFLQYFFALKLNIFPVARIESFSHTILPAIALAATPTTFIARLTKANLLEVLAQDYIKLAYSKGFSSTYVIIRHGLRNCALPLIGYLGPIAAQIFTGSFVIEKIFGIPGLGQWLVMSIANRDYTAIMGITLFFAALLIFLVYLSDLLYLLVDPRLRRGVR